MRVLPATLRGRVLAGDLALAASMALATSIVAALVGPPLFHEHLAQAEHGDPAAAVLHAEEAFRFAGTIALSAGLLSAAAGAALIGLVFTRPLRRSLADLGEAAAQVAAGDFGRRVDAGEAGAELEALADSFNTMAARLGQTEATRRRLLADLAHELRTPIAALELTLEALEDGVIVADSAALATLREQTARLSRLSSDLREVSAAEEGRIRLDMVPVDPASLLDQARRAVAEEAARTGITLTLALPPAPAPRVEADPQRILQVLANLLSNALRHTPAGGTITLGLADAPQAVQLSVTDTGEGIAAEHLPHIFERFYRTDTARDRDHGGSGIGLAISRAIVAAHGGTLTAESEGPGHGTRFTLRLPLRPEAPVSGS